MKRLFRHLPPELQSAVAAAWKLGEAPRAISDRYKVSEESIRRRFDPVWAARRQAMINEARKRRTAPKSQLNDGCDNRHGTRREIRADAERLVGFIPRDTRSLTGRIFGDPLPGRSALDKERRRASFFGVPFDG